jgi:hypothetical protein
LELADLEKLTQLRASWAEIRVIGKVGEQVKLEILHRVVSTVPKHLKEREKILEPTR